jgi:hypothetical protein
VIEIVAQAGGVALQRRPARLIGIRRMMDLADGPIAALREYLGRRGLLDSTLVVWGGEFGRMPVAETFNTGGKPGGRDHNLNHFIDWLVGGGPAIACSGEQGSKRSDSRPGTPIL